MAKRHRLNLVFALFLGALLAWRSIAQVVSDPAHGWLYAAIVAASSLLCIPVFFQFERSPRKPGPLTVLGLVTVGLVLIALIVTSLLLPEGWPKTLAGFTQDVFLYTMLFWSWFFTSRVKPPASRPAAPAVQR